MGMLDPYVIIQASDKVAIDKIVKVLENIKEAFQNPSVLKMYKELCNQGEESKHPFKAKGIVKALKKCLISHRFTEAAKLMECLACENGHHETVFKAGFQILENHPNMMAEKIFHFMGHMLRFSCLFRSEVALEAVIYYIKCEEFGKAQECIKELTTGRRCSYARADPLITRLLKGYDGLLNYIEWTKWKLGSSSNNIGDEEQNLDMEQKLKNASDKAIVAFKGLLSEEGPWDIFVVKLVEILEYYHRMNEAEEALMQYKERNPLHIHAYVYLYEFYQNNNYEQLKQIQCLKEIIRLSPSDCRVLDYVMIAKEDNINKCIPVMFDYLNYASNKNELTAWLLFVQLLMDVLKCNIKEELCQLWDAWEQHKSFWPAYQFHASSVKLTNEESAKLAVAKATALYILDGETDNSFVSQVQSKLNSLSLYPHLQLELSRNLNTVSKIRPKFCKKRKLSEVA